MYPIFSEWKERSTQRCKFIGNNLNISCVKVAQTVGANTRARHLNKKLDIYHGLPAPEIYTTEYISVTEKGSSAAGGPPNRVND